MSLLPVIRVRPFRDESPSSVLLRSSSLNGYTSPIKQLNQLKSSHRVLLSPSLQTIVSNPKQFELACEILGVDLTYLESIKPVREHQYPHADYFIGGILARRKHVSKSTRYCPRCLNEKQYFRKIWDYELYTSCHEHGLAIIDHCDVCGEKISWNRRHISECQCGAKLGLIEITAKHTLASNIFFDTFNSKHMEQFELMMDMCTALAEHYHLRRDNPEILNLSAMGVDAPIDLAKSLVLEMQRMHSVLMHPLLSFQSFIKHPNPKVQDIAKYAAAYVPNTDTRHNEKSNISDTLSMNLAARVLGAKPKDIKALSDAGLLHTKTATPDRTCPVLLNSINELVFRLSLQVQDVKLPTSRIEDVIRQSQECYDSYSVCDVVQKILDGDIKLASLSMKNPLSESIIQTPELRRLPEKEVFPMVWIGDFADFVGIHPNRLREIIKAENGVEGYKGQNGTEHSTKKFLTLIHAKRLLEKFKKFHLGSNVSELSFDRLPKTDVQVLILNR